MEYGKAAFQLGFLIQHSWNRLIIRRACEPAAQHYEVHAAALSDWQEIVSKSDSLWVCGQNFMTLDGPAMDRIMVKIESDVINCLKRLFHYYDRFQKCDYFEIEQMLGLIRSKSW